jgi:hypothetical protein
MVKESLVEISPMFLKQLINSRGLFQFMDMDHPITVLSKELGDKWQWEQSHLSTDICYSGPALQCTANSIFLSFIGLYGMLSKSDTNIVNKES